MDVPGQTSPEPGPQPGDTPNPLAGPAAATPPPAAAPSVNTGLWSRWLPARPGAWSQRRKVTTGIVAVALAAGGGVAIADTSSPSPSISRSADGTTEVKPDPGNDVRMRAPHMGLMKLGIGGGMVHGEFTVPDGDGGYKTVLMQNGTVASVSGGMLTVKSADGWSKDYALDTSTMIGGERFWSADSASGLTQGQQVLVKATVKDGSAHADHIQTKLDKAELEKRGMNMKFDMDEMKGRMIEPGGPGDRVFKFRGGPDSAFAVPAPGMGGEMMTKPAPEDGKTSE